MMSCLFEVEDIIYSLPNMFPRTVLSMDDYKIQGILLLFVMMTLVDRRFHPPSLGVVSDRCGWA